MEYQSPFEDWCTYSTVHKPLPDFTCETGLVLSHPNWRQVSAIHWSTSWEIMQCAV